MPSFDPCRSDERIPCELLVLWLTSRCNLSCAYCYMAGGGGSGCDMPTGMVRQAIERFSGNGTATVQLAGGEPSLVPERVAEAADLAARAGCRRIALQTNGVWLDKALVSTIRSTGMAVGISLDGPVAVNDAVRGETRRVLRTLRLLEENDVPVGITTVVTRLNVKELERLLLLVARFPNVRSLGLDVLRIAGRASESMLPSPTELRDGYRALQRALAWVNSRRSASIALREADRVGAHSASSAYCPAARGRSVVVTPAGELFPCSSLVGRPQFHCGTVEAPDRRRIAQGIGLDAAACGDCAIRHACSGRCPARSLLNPAASRLDCVLREVDSDKAAGDTPDRAAVRREVAL
jgi:uncharacterized protein